MTSFNLSDWALRHRSLVWYFMIAFMAAGLFSYLKLGREEDPEFTIKTMLIQAQWPGASAEEITKQVTDRIEKKLEELEVSGLHEEHHDRGPNDCIRQCSRHHEAARHHSDLGPRPQHDLRHQVGFSAGRRRSGFQRSLWRCVWQYLCVHRGWPDATPVARSGGGSSRKGVASPECRHASISLAHRTKSSIWNSRPARLPHSGSTRRFIVSSLQAQNAIAPSGVLQAGPERISVRVNGQFSSEESLKAINLRVNDRFFPLTDVATITRAYTDPPTSLFRFKGEPAIGLTIGMKPGANLLEFGEALKQEMTRITADLPVGVGVHLVSDQPQIVDEAVTGFTHALFEAIVIVLAISFLSLGMRAGLVVAISIPLVLAITFVVMYYSGISLQRISLGALIIALGLLVDDAMIAVEMMVARLEVGNSLDKAATYVYTSTAFPMLTGTLVTVAGFIPIGLNSSAAGEFTFTLFVVIAVSLVVSWIVAVLFTPLLGVTILPETMKNHHEQKGLVRECVCARARPQHAPALGDDYRDARGLCPLACGMGFVQQQFFPSSDRNELIVDWSLPQNSSIAETNAQMARFEQEALEGNAGIDHWSTYVGQGAPRFLLSFDVQPADVSFGQIVIVTKGLEVRDRVKDELQSYLEEDLSRHRRLCKGAGHRPAGRTAGPVSRQWPGHRRGCGHVRSNSPALSPATHISTTWYSTGWSLRVL